MAVMAKLTALEHEVMKWMSALKVLMGNDDTESEIQLHLHIDPNYNEYLHIPEPTALVTAYSGELAEVAKRPIA